MRLSFRDILRMSVIGLFAAGYHAVYLVYLNPAFEYAGYRVEARDWSQWAYTYVIAVLPSIWQSGRNNAVASGVSLIYLLLYVPALITMCAMWVAPFSEYMTLAFALLVGQFIIQSSVSGRARISSAESYCLEITSPGVRLTLAIFTSISLVVFVLENKTHMRIVGLADVYELRFASRDATSLLSGYLSMWLLGVSIPYYLAIGVCRRVWWAILFSVALSIIIFMGNGAKSALFMPVQALIVGILVAKNRNSTQFLAVILALTMWALYLLDTDWLNFLKSLFVMRLLSTGGWTMTTYYEYFSSEGWTYYSHVGPIGAMIGKVYQLELGQLIGLKYSASADANFNANFWATDGVAALGVAGVLIVSLLMAAVLKLISKLTYNINARCASILLTGFWLSILNSSLFTSMFSGGGFIILILLYLARNKSSVCVKKIHQLRAVH